MPELPEVETVRAGLVPHVVGKTIERADLLHSRVARMSEFGLEPVVGATISAVVRRGKYLWMVTEAGALVAHLGMSGQFRINSNSKHLRARIHFTDGTALDFVDQRTFGHLHPDRLVATGDGGPGGMGSDLALIPQSAAHIGRDLLDPHCDIYSVARQVKRGRTEIKRVMLNQNIASGIGNIYADEALWEARVHPKKITSAMTLTQIRDVYEAARDVMAAALAVGGTSFDSLYVNVNGESGYFDRSLNVYGKTGCACERCGTQIERLVFMNRSSHVCPACQRRSL
ncbi:bifunctional DNA-formamidopyrimidine glycosylase/DNA-(apurinic or apyrimidinic site) lyase [Arcanobacterium haemolyticum]|uniref:Formamidopyrimidine-DNA glycosylase n=1 Tax=Arcanobacterium haemolyticum (strain ATCC 9345 / DSM 20595 / CCM 5947 / CCUG 17215 / LMG 16163 / NBRC 15585 / NCTC 8452 / 11018) TaxID=644284 RepID=D7BPE4_ARCHD|nr:bifunctional DNA-formamidopyrimidine glycosylase/DNA-(apurinic or apyrimidinic site) lyase [Arcanobacterium haemolyticum]ADH92793.1 formamidopyrimidine-DNA glycosylase [Arcanobacterium haemolyticum DSM 20595]SQH28459.1 Formamidopyrimidine-DNA glycosylase [Arcanobacterium haemolyticum]